MPMNVVGVELSGRKLDGQPLLLDEERMGDLRLNDGEIAGLQLKLLPASGVIHP